MLKRFALVAIIGLICVVATGCRCGAPLLEDMGLQRLHQDEDDHPQLGA